jgi:hypothetical protein
MTGLTITGDLTVTGGASSLFSGNSSSDLVRVTQTGTGNAFVVEDSNNPDSTPFVIDANGRVGIGGVSLSEKLNIDGNISLISSASTKINIESGAGVRTYLAADGQGSSFGSLSNHDVVFYRGNSEFARRTATGFGIGTATPSAKLDVSGDTKISGGLTATTISATTYYNLPTDVTVTGGTYAAGTATFTNNTGGTFNVTGFSTGTTTGLGTANYLTKWTGSTGQGNSIIRDDGTNIGIGTAPEADNKFSIFTVSNNTYGLWVRNASNISGAKGIYGLSNGNVGTQTGVWGVGEGHPTTGTSIGVDGGATDGLLGIGVRGTVGTSEFGSMVTGIGGYFDGRGDGGYGYPSISYSVQLLDGTEGINKVLVSQTADGRANWSSTLSGLTTVAAATVSATTFIGDVAAVTVSATTFIGDGSQITNIPVPYGIISAIASGNYLI